MIRVVLLTFLLVTSVNAADWLTLQGTQKKAGHNLWGFFQVKAENNEGKVLIKNGINKTPFSYIKPNLENQSQVQLGRLRIGLRGSLDKENMINYFFLTEFAQNGVNNPLGYYNPTYLTDASITLKYLPMNVRVGKFKYAGSEEGLMTRFASPFINFTSVSNQLMLERFVENELSKPTQGVGAYRDSGVQLFKTFKLSELDRLSLSYMLGNGSGSANENVNQHNYTQYAYISYEKVLGKGKGYKEETFKLYGWYQNGKRSLNVAGVDELYDRERYGLGMTYFYNNLRVEAEYMSGSGMIVNGVKDVNSVATQESWVYAMSPSSDNRADGYYIASTYAVLEPLEILARYDVYDRLTNDASLYRKFETITMGFSYKFQNYDRIDINYDVNSIKAPSNSVADELLTKTVGNLLSLQFTMVFK